MINVPVSIGELFDKISILQIKKAKVKNKEKLKNIKKELKLLKKISSNLNTNEISDLLIELRNINLYLWNVETKVRREEQKQFSNEEFVELARSIYKYNDKRASIKKQINLKMNSDLIEEKEH